MTRLLLVLVMLAAPMFGAPDFSGSWMLNTGRSQFGQFPAPDVMLRTVKMNGSQLTMSTYQKGAQGEVTSELKYTTDGRPVVNGASRGTARFDGDTLIIESSREAQGMTLTQRDAWTLSADKKTLTVQSHIRIPGGEFDVKQVFEKAPGLQ
jgi:hypothetical protein